MKPLLIGLVLASIGIPVEAPISPVVKQEVDIRSKPTVKELISIKANKYHVNEYTLNKVIACESNYNEKAWNKKDPYGGAKGIAQFLQPTFNYYSDRLKLDGDIWNTENQLEIMAYMFSIGEAHQWSCYKNV